MKPRLPELSFLTLAEMARAAGLTEDAIRVYADDGLLKLTAREIDGTDQLGATAEEWRRFTNAPATSSAQLREDAKQSYVEAVALALAFAWGGDPGLFDHYTLAGNLEEFAAKAKIPLTRGRETHAQIFKAAASILKQCGFLRQPEKPRTAPRPGTETHSAPPRFLEVR